VRPPYTRSPQKNKQLGEEYDTARKAFHETPDYQAYSANRDHMHALVKDCPAELYIWNSSEDSEYCVRIVTSVQRVDDWGSIELSPLEVDPAWRDQLLQFMMLLELPVPEGKDPGWHMCCSYG
jgi:ferredoxin-like protein FixX